MLLELPCSDKIVMNIRSVVFTE